jgi:hypothetical protein
MQHDQRDGTAAVERARSGYSSTWHPILAAQEIEPGHWNMLAQYGECYGVIRMLRIDDELGYRAVTWAPQSQDRELIGYFTTLRAAAYATHMRFVRSHGQSGGVNG